MTSSSPNSAPKSAPRSAPNCPARTTAPDDIRTPIRQSVTVPLPRDAAFDLFTREIAAWWPIDGYSFCGGAVRLEPREGGRILERQPDGSDAAWARITLWQPPLRLALLWHPGRDAAEATDVDIAFNEVEDGTEVTVTHQGFDRLGPNGTDVHGSYAAGWPRVLGALRAAARAHAPAAEAPAIF